MSTAALTDTSQAQIPSNPIKNLEIFRRVPSRRWLRGSPTRSPSTSTASPSSSSVPVRSPPARSPGSPRPGRSCASSPPTSRRRWRPRSMPATSTRSSAERSRPADLDGVRLVVTATGDRRRPRRRCGSTAAGIWVNAADRPDDCSFILPAVARNGSLTIAVSTDGASPALAQRLRDEAAGLLTDDVAALAERLAATAGRDQGSRADRPRTTTGAPRSTPCSRPPTPPDG